MKGNTVTSGRGSRVEEERWLDAARSGDADAFGLLYRRYLCDVRDFCARRIGDPIRAEDIAQDTFVKAFERIASFRPGAPFWPWLSIIARNSCIDELRHRGRSVEGTSSEIREPEDPAAAGPDPSEQAVAHDTRTRIEAAVAAAMEQLSDRDRRLLWHRAVDEMSWEEIASRNQTSLHAARNAAWRARGLLRSMLVDSLQDLRAWIPSLPLIAHLRRTWARFNNRAASRTLLASDAAFAHVTDLVLAAVVLSGTLLGGSLAGTSAPRPGAASSDVAMHAVSATGSAQAPDDAASQAGGEHMTNGPVRASVETRHRPGAAGPSRVVYRVEIAAPNGKVLYWRETDFSCGDGRTSPVLPHDGPVRAYC